MKTKIILLFFVCALGQTLSYGQIAGKEYLDSLKHELRVKWPNNKMINLVFHGHSVPSGYLTGGVTDRLDAYPFRTLKHVNDHYPYSVVNSITTTIGGEQAEQGALRMTEVLHHKPGVVFIDYALNDRSIGLERAKRAWESMIKEVLAHDIKLILLTPTPDLREDIASEEANLEMHSQQIRDLAKKYKVGLVDSYAFFKKLAETEDLKAYMSQNNHINQKGHQFVADLIFENYFSWKD